MSCLGRSSLHTRLYLSTKVQEKKENGGEKGTHFIQGNTPVCAGYDLGASALFIECVIRVWVRGNITASGFNIVLKSSTSVGAGNFTVC